MLSSYLVSGEKRKVCVIVTAESVAVESVAVMEKEIHVGTSIKTYY